MPRGRHRKTVPARVRAQRIGLPAAMSLALGTMVTGSAASEQAPRASEAAAFSSPRALPERAAARTVSRSFVREEPPSRADLAAIAERVDPPLPDPEDLKTRWVTADLNVWSGAGERSRLLTVLDSGVKVRFTGEVEGAWAQILRKDRLAWVRKAYLVREKQEAGSVGAGVTSTPCPDGSSVESGLTANAVKVYRSVCAAFPEVSSWGGLRGSGGDHGTGQALDIMASGSLGDAIAEYVRAHAGELGVSEVIWSQKIWSVLRGSEGWRWMEDRGSTTANHYDHVHVSVY